MEIVTLIIAAIALGIAAIAFQRTGGMKDLQRRAKGVSSRTKMVRNRTAKMLARLQRTIRGTGKDRDHQQNGAEKTATRRSGRLPRRSASGNSTRSSRW